jgi:hypothetical protein
MKRWLVIFALCIPAFAACPDVANSAGYVRAAAAGTASGADWTNAYTVLPASLVRGCTYYVAGGSYAAHTFNDADSGTTLITIQAPTIAVHGTATGWSNAYQAQATFTAPINFTGSSGGTSGDYYTVNGVYRTSTGSPWLDWRTQSGYGFAVNNNNGSNCPITSSGAAVQVGSFNGNAVASHVSIEYLNVIGSSNFSQVCSGNFDWGIDVNGFSATTSTFYLGYSYIHDTAADNVLVDGVNGATLEYDYIDRSSEGGATNHMEEVAIRNNTDNFIFRYSFVGACGDTACLASPNASGARSNWYIYRNVFFINSAETPVSYSSGDGAFSIFSLTSLTGGGIVQNTISTLPVAGACMIFPWTPVTTTSVLVQDNLWFGCPQNNNPALNTGVTWSYNEYDGSSYCTAGNNCMYQNDADTNKTGSASNPFVSVAQIANDNNFNLLAHTTAGTSMANYPTGCTESGAGKNCADTDMNGVTGTDRGALNYSASSGPATNVYISQSGGTFSGGTACNGQTALSCGGSGQSTCSAFNNAANWGTGATQIGAGTTVWVCGTITAAAAASGYMTFQAGGTSGSPITLRFDSGASLQAPYFGANGAVYDNGQTYVTVDGNQVGTIENTLNGSPPCALTSLSVSGGTTTATTTSNCEPYATEVVSLSGTSVSACNVQVTVLTTASTTFTFATPSSCTNATGGQVNFLCPGGTCADQITPSALVVFTGGNDHLKNITLSNVYNHGSFSDNCCANTNGVTFLGVSNVTISNSLVHDSRFCFNGFGNTIVVQNNECYNSADGFWFLPNVATSSLSITNNYWHAMEQWATTAVTYHLEAIQIGPATGTANASGVTLASNYAQGGSDCCNTAHFFISGLLTSPLIYNNICNNASVGNGPFHMPCIDLLSSPSYVMTGVSILNNTFIGGDYTFSGNTDVNAQSVSGLTMENNIVVGGNQLLAVVGDGTDPVTTITAMNNNMYENIIAQGATVAFQLGINNYTTLTAWRTACSCDGASTFTATASLGVQTTGVPPGPGLLQLGSPSIRLGINLTSLGISGLNVGAPATFGVAGACGSGCVNRVTTGAWDAGAYPFTGYQAPAPWFFAAAGKANSIGQAGSR